MEYVLIIIIFFILFDMISSTFFDCAYKETMEAQAKVEKELKKQLVNKKEAIEDILFENDGLRAKIDTLENSIVKYKNSTYTLDEKIIDLEIELSALAQLLDEEKVRSDKLDKEAANLAAKLRTTSMDLDRNIVEYERKIKDWSDACNTNNLANMLKINELEEQNDELKQQLKDSEDNFNASEKEKGRLETCIYHVVDDLKEVLEMLEN